MSDNCVRVSPSKFHDLLERIQKAYKSWRNLQTLDCIKKHGLRQKAYFPEQNDISLLGQAIVNKDGNDNGEKRVLLLTNDAHFLCHSSTIKNTFGVEILDYHKL